MVKDKNGNLVPLIDRYGNPVFRAIYVDEGPARAGHIDPRQPLPDGFHVEDDNGRQ